MTNIFEGNNRWINNEPTNEIPENKQENLRRKLEIYPENDIDKKFSDIESALIGVRELKNYQDEEATSDINKIEDPEENKKKMKEKTIERTLEIVNMRIMDRVVKKMSEEKLMENIGQIEDPIKRDEAVFDRFTELYNEISKEEKQQIAELTSRSKPEVKTTETAKKEERPIEKTELKKVMVEESKNKEMPQEIKKESEQEIKIEKRYFELLSTSLKKLVYRLNEREGNRLNRLLLEGEAGRIAHSVNAIEDNLNQKKTGIEFLNNKILSINSVMEKIGTVRNQGAVREDTENLKTIMFCLRQIEEGCRTFRGAFSKIENKDLPEIEQIKRSLNKLFDTTQEKWSHIAKLNNDLEDYHRRR